MAFEVQPNSMIEYRDPAEMHRFHDNLLANGFSKIRVVKELIIQPGKAQNSSIDTTYAKPYFRNLNAYLVNIASLEWSEGVKEKMQFLKRVFAYEGTAEEKLKALEDLINAEILSSEKISDTLSQNCNILQKELGV